MAEQEHRFSVITKPNELTGTDVAYVVDESLSDLREYEPLLFNAFQESGQKHIRAAKGLLSLLPHDPERYPYQRLDVVEARPSAAGDPALMDAVAGQVYPNYPELRDLLRSPRHRGAFEFVLERLGSGSNFAFFYDHGRITNTPLAQKAVGEALAYTAQQLGTEVPPHVSRITVSKLLAFFGALGLPAVEVLSIQGRVGMSLPRSKSMEKAGLPPKAQGRYNESFKEVRKLDWIEGFEEAVSGLLLPAEEREYDLPEIDHVSVSGSVDVPISRFVAKYPQRSATHMAPAAQGTVDMFGRSIIIPASVNVNRASPRVAIGQDLPAPEVLSDVHTAMIRVAELARLSTGEVHVYHFSKEDYDRATEKKVKIHKT